MTQREHTMDALMDATVRLLAERSEAEITVRDIGAAAGVNHGLVHHYFGSKGGLIRTAVERASRRLYAEQPDTIQIGRTFGFFREHPDYVRIIARVVLDGPGELLPLVSPPRQRLEGWLAQVEAELRALGEGATTARVLNAFGVAAVLGWMLFQPLLTTALDLPPEADDVLAGLLERVDGYLGRGAQLGPGHDRGTSK